MIRCEAHLRCGATYMLDYFVHDITDNHVNAVIGSEIHQEGQYCREFVECS
jgi:hypothetical protein